MLPTQQTRPSHVAPAGDTTCVIAGCGPAGAVLGLLLARAGVEVTVLEKHGDFLRDFRGDTIHPSTLQVLDEMGLLDRFLQLPHQKLWRIEVETDSGEATFADLSSLRHPHPYIALVPQWDFLDLLTTEAARYPTFDLRMNAEVDGVIEENGQVCGVHYHDAAGTHEARAALTVAADGRHSVVRHEAGLKPIEFGAPMDVLWLRVSRQPSDPENAFGRLSAGRFLALIRRPDHWQIAYVFPKHAYEQLRARGIEGIRADIAELAPFLANRVAEISDWEDVPMLRVQVDRLRRWHRPGLLCVGDAAHAMSPVGGVGINLAVQDAVAAANLLTEPLRARRVSHRQLARVQRRRWLPTVGTQAIQRLIQRRVIRPVISASSDSGALPLPAPLRVFGRVPWARRIPARFIGIGIRPEHVRVPAARAAGERRASEETVAG